MNAWSAVKAFMTANAELITLISLTTAVLGLLLAYVFYKRAKPVKRLAYAIRTFRVVSDRYSKVRGLEVNLDGQLVPALSVSRVAIWNAGTETLRAHDIAESDPLRLVPKSGVRIIRADLLEFSRDANRVILLPDSTDGVPRVAFEFLDTGDGLLVEVTHTGLQVDQVALVGSVIGGRIQRTAADPEYTVSAAPPSPTPIYTTESHRASHLLFAKTALVLSFPVGIAAIVAGVIGYGDFAVGALFALVLLICMQIAIRLYVARTYPPPSIVMFDKDL